MQDRDNEAESFRMKVQEDFRRLYGYTMPTLSPEPVSVRELLLMFFGGSPKGKGKGKR